MINGYLTNDGSETRNSHTRLRMADIKNIAILNNILFTFKSQFTMLPRLSHTPQGHQVIIGNRLSANKALLQVAVDHTGGHRARVCHTRIVQARTSSSPTVKKLSKPSML